MERFPLWTSRFYELLRGVDVTHLQCGLKTIYCKNDWRRSDVTSTRIFDSCKKLRGGYYGIVLMNSSGYNSIAYCCPGARGTYGFFTYPGSELPKEIYSKIDGTTLYIVAASDTESAYYESLGYTLYSEKLDRTSFSSNPFVTDGSTVTKVDLQLYGARPIYTAAWFKGLSALESITGLNTLNTEDVVSMANMFCDCESLTSLDLSGFDTQTVTNMDRMFRSCKNLKSLNLSNFDFTAITTRAQMFSNSSFNYIDMVGAKANSDFLSDTYGTLDNFDKTGTLLYLPKNISIPEGKTLNNYITTTDGKNFTCQSLKLLNSSAGEPLTVPYAFEALQAELYSGLRTGSPLVGSVPQLIVNNNPPIKMADNKKCNNVTIPQGEVTIYQIVSPTLYNYFKESLGQNDDLTNDWPSGWFTIYRNPVIEECSKPYPETCPVDGSPKALDISTLEGVKAYTVTGVDMATKVVTLTEQNCLLPDAPMLIYSEKKLNEVAGEPLYIMDSFTENNAEKRSTIFIGNSAKSTIPKGGTDAYYVLYGGKFVYANTGSLLPGRCYLKVGLEASANAARQFSLTVGDGSDDQTTGVGTLLDDLQTEQWYDLNGRRVDGPQGKGVYIVNGRKVVIK